jgi:hypothetical protein
VIRSLPGPLGGFPVVCRVVTDDMSNSWERKMIAHHHDPVGRDPVEDGLARLDRLCGIVVEDRTVGRTSTSVSPSSREVRSLMINKWCGAWNLYSN